VRPDNRIFGSVRPNGGTTPPGEDLARALKQNAREFLRAAFRTRASGRDWRSPACQVPRFRFFGDDSVGNLFLKRWFRGALGARPHGDGFGGKDGSTPHICRRCAKPGSLKNPVGPKTRTIPNPLKNRGRWGASDARTLLPRVLCRLLPLCGRFRAEIAGWAAVK